MLHAALQCVCCMHTHCTHTVQVWADRDSQVFAAGPVDRLIVELIATQCAADKHVCFYSNLFIGNSFLFFFGLTREFPPNCVYQNNQLQKLE